MKEKTYQVIIDYTSMVVEINAKSEQEAIDKVREKLERGEYTDEEEDQVHIADVDIYDVIDED